MRIPLLLLGSLLLLTPACDTGSDWVTQSTEVESLALTPTEPHLERRLHVVARARPDTGAKISVLHITFETEPRWERPEAGGSDVHPWYRVRLVDERDGQVVDERVTVFGEGSTPDSLSVGPDVDIEDEISRFEATYRLELDRQGPPSAGTLHVNWSVITEALTDADDLERVEVLLTQP
ncbi:hypothetical protein [Corallococcus llansteffanensis]|uniref:hypothetical protein n=1 Tax=Corallococcus llansteffanensis TaxID=2316731 RepID=UPI0011C3903E|nr:hypothetical protein [Corallococcus llansteffanensis]